MKSIAKFIIIIMLLYNMLLLGCETMKLKVFSFNGYENITTFFGPKERDEKIISNENITIFYSALSISVRNNIKSYALFSVENDTEKVIEIKNLEWGYIYNGKLLKDEYEGDDKAPASFSLESKKKKIFQFATSKTEKDFVVGDKINVIIKFTYSIGNKEYTIDETNETICHLKAQIYDSP